MTSKKGPNRAAAAVTAARNAPAAALIALLTLVGGAQAGVLTVSKVRTGEEAGMYGTIQEAVNAARPGDVIEILDTEIYREQITIDGREVSPWDGKNQGPIKKVVGGKNGITIRYAPTGARLFGNHARPTIMWKDTINISPRNTREGEIDGDTLGSSGNFETCGTLRIIRAQGVTIDGIKVDGGGAKPFGTSGVWGTEMFHGNAAVAIVVAGGAVIRNCDLGNAFYGIAVKDRNLGGVFGNPNPGDLIVGTAREVLPLSGFGKVGNHLFEYNKVHDNMTAIFTESAWDLATTIRYNLIYNNRHKPSLVAGIPGNNKANGGAILFRDALFAPFAIYNNTFFGNSRNLMGEWKAGATHLVFNNIFSKPDSLKNGLANRMTLEGVLPYRMHNSVFSANEELKYERANVGNCQRAQIQGPNGQGILVEGVYGQQILGFTQVQVAPLPQPANALSQVRCLEPIADSVVNTNAFIPPGAILAGQGGFEAAANLRWLETARSITGTEDLFVSTDPASNDFLRPKWTDPLVEKFIKGQGWELVDMRNSDGTIADLGAISSTGKALPTVARVKPANVVLVSGTSADANYFVSVESGSLKDAKVSFLRWVAPLPTEEKAAIPKARITSPTKPTGSVAVNGNNNSRFTIAALPQTQDTLGQYGFFEIAVKGKDANNNDVTSDIGFLPYRKLEYTLRLEVRDGTRKVDTVRAGVQYTLNVKPCKGTNTETCASYTDGDLSNVSFELQSGPASFMYVPPASNWPDNPFVYTSSVAKNGQDFPVYFTHAGGETIMSTGVSVLSGDRRLVFIGTVDIYVKPGDPAKIVFVDPIPASRLGGALAPIINRGVPKDVSVEVQDKYGNAVDQQVRVDIVVSANPDVGDVGAPGNIGNKTVTTAGATGIATFVAVAKGSSGQTFDMTASFTSGSASGSDVGRLRVGRTLDRFQVFYSDNGASKRWEDYYDPTVGIDRNVGEWEQVTVKVVVGDSVNTGSTGKYVFIDPDDNNLVFRATEGGGALTNVFPLVNGVATFWVGAAEGTNRAITNAAITVYALNSTNVDDRDGSIREDSRAEINFKPLTTSIGYAVVYGDGQGRPDSVYVHYKEGSAPLSGAGAVKPTMVTLDWGGVKLTAEGAAVTAVSPTVLRAVFTGEGDLRLKGKTFITGLGTGLVEVTGGIGGASVVEKDFDVYDGIGPLLTKGDPSEGAVGSAPLIHEYDGGGTDIIEVTLSEEIRDYLKLTRLYYSPPPAEPSETTTGISIVVQSITHISGNTYELVVAHTDDGPIPDGWIRLDPGTVTDIATDIAKSNIAADNKPHARNRWVQLKELAQPPDIKAAWWTAKSATGRPEFVYVAFSKRVDLAWWFNGGSVNVDGVRPVSDLNAFFPAVMGDTLVISLSEVSSLAKESAPIKTSGEIPFTLTYNPATGWGVPASYKAVDRAKPVLAKSPVLRTGSINADGSFNEDTLVVYYSEQIGAGSLSLLGNHITLWSKDGKYVEFRPTLELLGKIEYNNEYVGRYKVVGDLVPFPESGDSVRIYAAAGIGDDMEPSNVQGDGDNKPWPLVVARASNWTVKVKGNPFVSDASMQNSMGIELSPNAKGLGSVAVKAYIKVFDNLGALVVDTAVVENESKLIDWKWYGTNKNGRDGRLVGSGTYLLKAICESKAEGDSRAEVYKVPPKALGVVRR